MNRSRLLLTLPTVVALTVGGASTAVAGEPRDRGPEVYHVSDVYAEDKHPEEVWVKVWYKCKSKWHKGTLDLLLRQRAYDDKRDSKHGYDPNGYDQKHDPKNGYDNRGSWKHEKARYDAYDVKVRCDGERRRTWVHLDHSWERKNRGYLHDGPAHLDVTLTEWGRYGDVFEDTFYVEVVGAGDHKRDRKGY